LTRIKPITDRSQLPADRQHEWDTIFKAMGRVRGPFGVMLNAPELGPSMLNIVLAGQDTSIVPDALHELAILAVAREHDAPYQWTAHIARARAAGLSDAAVEAARRRDGAVERLAQDERDVIELTRELCRTERLSQKRFDELRGRHGEQWLLLVVATIGQYRYVATFNNAFEIDPLPVEDQLPV
jgi:4-carboxymuconolactone decarboxylase